MAYLKPLFDFCYVMAIIKKCDICKRKCEGVKQVFDRSANKYVNACKECAAHLPK